MSYNFAILHLLFDLHNFFFFFFFKWNFLLFDKVILFPMPSKSTMLHYCFLETQIGITNFDIPLLSPPCRKHTVQKQNSKFLHFEILRRSQDHSSHLRFREVLRQPSLLYAGEAHVKERPRTRWSGDCQSI